MADLKELKKIKTISTIGVILSLLSALAFYIIGHETDKLMKLDETKLDQVMLDE